MKSYKELTEELFLEGHDRYPGDDMTMKELKIAVNAAKNILDMLEDGASIQRWQISAIVVASDELASVCTSMRADYDEEMEDEDEYENEVVAYEYPWMGEETEIDESFASSIKRAIAAHDKGDHQRAKYHLDIAKTARYGMKSTEIAKNKELLDKYKELAKMHEEVELDEAKKDHFVYQKGVPKTKEVVHRGTEQSSKDWIEANAKFYGHKGKDFVVYKGKYPNIKPSDKLDYSYVAEEVELNENPWNQRLQKKPGTEELPAPAKGTVEKHGRKFKQGDMVVPHTGPHAGVPHKVTSARVGSVNIIPMISANKHKYDNITIRAKHQHLSPHKPSVKENIELDETFASRMNKASKKSHADASAKRKQMSKVTSDTLKDINDKLGNTTKKEEVDYKVSIDGLPDMYIKAKSPAEVKANLRKIVKKPDMVKSVDRVTQSVIKKIFRDKAAGKEDLDEAIDVRHDRYMRSHGKKASGGMGTWMFTHKNMGDVDYNNEKDVHMAPRGKFSDAAKSAKAWAKKHGHSTVYVMEEVEN